MIGEENDGAFPDETRSPSTTSMTTTVRRFGDYELLEEIARGGMGVVYKARQVSLNRIVAVKVILAWQFAGEESVQRFRAEAAAAACLQHPHIVAVHEVGQQEGQDYFSMDYIEGQNLSALVRDKPLSAARAARYVRIIAEAIQYAHRQGIVHRDLKPSNVLIDITDQPRVTDFGLAKHITGDSDLTATGQVLGSPNYLPPEQAAGKLDQIGPRSDVYSLGAILYHLLTGRPPFLAETLPEMLAQVVNAEPAAPRLLNPGIPRDMETICLKCLEKDPHRRYQTAQDLADELGRYLRGETILARPVHVAEEFWRWCRRQPALAGLGFAVAALLIIVAIGSTLAAVRFNRLRAEADRKEAEARLRRYVADMNVALQDGLQGNAAQAVALLQANKPKSGEADLRGFEWRYIWRLCHPKPFGTFPKRDQVLGAMQFSPNGKILAAYYWDNTLRLWNRDTEQELLILPGASALGAFSADGRSFVSSTTNGSIDFYRLDSGKPSLVKTNAGEIVACAADGKTVVTIDRDGVLKVRDLDSDRVIFSPPQVVRPFLDYGWGRLVTISPDGKTLAVIQSSRDLRRLDSSIKLWDVASGTELPSLTENRQIHSLQFSPDGRQLAVGDGLGGVKLWDIAGPEFKLIEAYDLPVSALAFSADGKLLATGSSAPLIKLWNVATGLQLSKTFHGHIGQVHSLAFSPDGKLLASGARNGPISIWNVESEEPPDQSHELLAEHWGNITFSPDSKSVAAGCKGNRVKVWNVDDFSVRAALPGASYAVAFTRDGKELLTASMDETPQWWQVEAKTSRPIPRYPGGMTNRVTCVDLSPNRRTAVLGHMDGAIQLFEIDSGKEIARWQGHTDEVRSVAFSPTGDQLVSGGRDRSVSVWDVATRQRLASSGEHKGAVCAVAFSHNGRRIASGCGAGTIKLWDPAEVSRRSQNSIAYHQDVIRTLAFSPDDQTLASGSEDHTVKLWNTTLGRQVASFQHDGPIRLVLFSPDGNTLAIVTDNGTLQLLRSVSLEAADREDNAGQP
jgi:WD40 repeat protein/predicted Ser/Thr protein kinase